MRRRWRTTRSNRSLSIGFVSSTRAKRRQILMQIKRSGSKALWTSWNRCDPVASHLQPSSARWWVSFSLNTRLHLAMQPNTALFCVFQPPGFSDSVFSGGMPSPSLEQCCIMWRSCILHFNCVIPARAIPHMTIGSRAMCTLSRNVEHSRIFYWYVANKLHATKGKRCRTHYFILIYLSVRLDLCNRNDKTSRTENSDQWWQM